MKSILLLLLVSLAAQTDAQVKNDDFLVQLLQKNKDSLFREVLQQPDKYRYQVIYTQINRDRHNQPTFSNYYLNVDPLRYFYPASVVKLPLAVLSLQHLHELNRPGITRDTPILFDSAFTFQHPMHTDPTSKNGLPSIAQFIRKAFLVSDNDAYNRMYQFLGQQYINRQLRGKGFPHSRITRQFQRITPAENRQTNPYRFLDSAGKELMMVPTQYNKDSFDFRRQFSLGRAHINWQDSLVETPLEFTTHNYIPLEGLQRMLQSILFPESMPAAQRFALNAEDGQFLYQYLSQFPGETNYPKYDSSQYYDTYVKFFFKGPERKMPEGVRVFNKVGWAYGCLTDVSYVADFVHGIEFMLTATIYVNENGVLNDDTYQYEEVGLPFLYQLGQTIYRYELGRNRHHIPDLSRFRIRYEHQIDDGRPLVRDVDN